MADAGYLTIGKVVRRLQEQYPDLSISKVRYLEDEGLLTPSRTPGGASDYALVCAQYFFSGVAIHYRGGYAG